MDIKELRAKSADELRTLVAEKRAEITEKKRALKSGELANPRSITNLRREIATALTIIKEQNTAGSPAEEEK